MFGGTRGCLLKSLLVVGVLWLYYFFMLAEMPSNTSRRQPRGSPQPEKVPHMRFTDPENPPARKDAESNRALQEGDSLIPQPAQDEEDPLQQESQQVQQEDHILADQDDAEMELQTRPAKQEEFLQLPMPEENNRDLITEEDAQDDAYPLPQYDDQSNSLRPADETSFQPGQDDEDALRHPHRPSQDQPPTQIIQLQPLPQQQANPLQKQPEKKKDEEIKDYWQKPDRMYARWEREMVRIRNTFAGRTEKEICVVWTSGFSSRYAMIHDTYLYYLQANIR